MSLYKYSDIDSIESLSSHYFFCSWHMTPWCNYHCSYCINAALRDEIAQEKWIDDDVLINKAKEINKLIKKANHKNLPIKLKIIGGEVTYNNIPKIISEIDNIRILVVASNFSREIDFFKKLYHYCYKKDIILILSLSYHEENTTFADKFIEICNWCKENNYREPQAAFVITNDFDFSIIDKLIDNNAKRIKLIRERQMARNETSLKNSMHLKKLADYEKIVYKESTTFGYKVTFKDKSIKLFNNLHELFNNLDTGGFLPDGIWCDAGCNKIAINYDDSIYYNNCPLLLNRKKGINKKLGKLGDDIDISDNLLYCNLQSDSEKEYCMLCNNISIWKNNNDYRK